MSKETTDLEICGQCQKRLPEDRKPFEDCPYCGGDVNETEN